MNPDWTEIASREASYQAAMLIRCGHYARQDREDLQQELLLNAWRRRRFYDPARARATTFIRLVMKNRVAELVKDSRQILRIGPWVEDIADPEAEIGFIWRELAISQERLPRPQKVLLQFCLVMNPGEIRRRSRITKPLFFKHLIPLRAAIRSHLRSSPGGSL